MQMITEHIREQEQVYNDVHISLVNFAPSQAEKVKSPNLFCYYWIIIAIETELF